MRKWLLGAGAILLIGTLLGALVYGGHDPNHDINRDAAKEAAHRVHATPPPGTKIVPGAGG